jgi:hypothetical protein
MPGKQLVQLRENVGKPVLGTDGLAFARLDQRSLTDHDGSSATETDP